MSWRSDEYWAGFFDGEGNIHIGRVPKERRNVRYDYYRVYAKVASTDLPILLKLQDDLGGLIYLIKHSHKAKKMAWSWQIHAAKFPEFIRRLLPYLIIKREVAELALELQTGYRLGGRHINLSLEMIARREEIWLAARKLNKRGNPINGTVSVATGMAAA